MNLRRSAPVLIALAIFFSIFSASAAVAAKQAVAQPELTAEQVIIDTTDRVMVIIEEAQGYYQQDPERFYQAIEAVLVEVVDFDSFARGVMGEFASRQGYMALKTKEEKAAYRARMARFSQVFKDGLVRTYAKGLLAFNGNKIEVLPGDDESEQGSVTVEQRIYGDAEKPYVVYYKMRQDRSGDWKLRNVTIEAVNLGLVYQNQFSSAVNQYGGDVDKVIDNWSVDPTVNNEAVGQLTEAPKAGTH